MKHKYSVSIPFYNEVGDLIDYSLTPDMDFCLDWFEDGQRPVVFRGKKSWCCE